MLVAAVAMIAVAMAVVMAVAFAVKSAIAAEPAVSATESVIPAIEAAVAMEITANVGISASNEAPEALVAVIIPAASEVAVVISAESVTASEAPIAVIATMVPPAVAMEAAPTVAIAEVTPAIVIVEIDPGRIVKVVVASAIERRAIESPEPRTRADENTAHEPLRPVVAVRSACVRGIWIVAVRADRRRAYIHRRANANSDSNAHLGVSRARHCTGQRNNQSNYCGVFENSHLGTSLPDLLVLRHTQVHRARDLPIARGRRKCS